MSNTAHTEIDAEDIKTSGEDVISLHDDSSEVTHGEKTYDIITTVRYNIEADAYICETRLLRTYESKRPSDFTSPNTRYTIKHVTTERNLVEPRLQSQIRECKRKIRYINERTDIDIEVDV